VFKMTPNEQKAINKLAEQYRRVSLNPKNFYQDTLYHYTSAAGFCGIVSSRVLRATNFSYLNDSNEILHGYEIVKKVINKHLNKPKSTKSKKFLSHAAERIEDINVGLEYYLACFCKKPDRLSQWRAYGSETGRYCVGFDTDRLLNTNPKTILSRVIYRNDEKQKKIALAINHAIESIKNGNSPDFLDQVYEQFMHKITNELCFFKDQSFEEEDEWRIVYVYKSPTKIYFDTSSGIIKPFVELCFPLGNEKSKDYPIVEVITGPAKFLSLSKKSARLLLSENGYSDVDINEFSSSFRDL